VPGRHLQLFPGRRCVSFPIFYHDPCKKAHSFIRVLTGTDKDKASDDVCTFPFIFIFSMSMANGRGHCGTSP